MSDKKSPTTSGTWGGRVALLKDLFALLRDLSIFVLGLLLLVFPSTLNKALTDAGFEEGSIVGLKWKRGFVETNDKLKVAEEALAKLQVQNDTLSRALTALAQVTDGEAKTTLSNIQAQSQRVSEGAKQVQISVNETLEKNEALAEKAGAFNVRVAYPRQAFCYQEDSLQEGAKRYSVHCHEAKQNCETARGPNKLTKQSQCEAIDLARAAWNPSHPGWMGSWYQFGRSPFVAPFPQFK